MTPAALVSPSRAPGEPTAPGIQRFCLLIGAMKSGTTTLFRNLVQHPEIAGSREKEPGFFSRADLRARGRLWYESLWDFDPRRHAFALEASTDYTKLPTTPSAAFFTVRFPADYRFVYVVRDPLERIRSHYRHGLAQGWIEKPIHEELQPEAVGIGNYWMQAWPYLAAHGRDSLLVIHHAELRSNLAGVLRRVALFLGVDPDFAFDVSPRHNTGDLFDQRGVARILARRGLIPDLVDPDALARRPAAEFEALCRGWAREAGSPAGYTEAVRAFERASTPTQEQAARVRALLRDDLDRFRDAFGVDPWSAESRAALERGARAA